MSTKKQNTGSVELPRRQMLRLVPEKQSALVPTEQQNRNMNMAIKSSNLVMYSFNLSNTEEIRKKLFGSVWMPAKVRSVFQHNFCFYFLLEPFQLFQSFVSITGTLLYCILCHHYRSSVPGIDCRKAGVLTSLTNLFGTSMNLEPPVAKQ